MLKVSCIVYVYPRPGQSVALSARGSLLLVVTRVPGGEEETHSQLSGLPLLARKTTMLSQPSSSTFHLTEGTAVS